MPSPIKRWRHVGKRCARCTRRNRKSALSMVAVGLLVVCLMQIAGLARLCGLRPGGELVRSEEASSPPEPSRHQSDSTAQPAPHARAHMYDPHIGEGPSLRASAAVGSSVVLRDRAAHNEQLNNKWCRWLARCPDASIDNRRGQKGGRQSTCLGTSMLRPTGGSVCPDCSQSRSRGDGKASEGALHFSVPRLARHAPRGSEPLTERLGKGN